MANLLRGCHPPWSILYKTVLLCLPPVLPRLLCRDWTTGVSVTSSISLDYPFRQVHQVPCFRGIHCTFDLPSGVGRICHAASQKVSAKVVFVSHLTRCTSILYACLFGDLFHIFAAEMRHENSKKQCICQKLTKPRKARPSMRATVSSRTFSRESGHWRTSATPRRRF